MQNHIRDNLVRLMAAQGLSIDELCARARLDKRTVQGILNGTHRPHARTLHRLTQGLGTSTDELFLDPARLLYRCFDRKTNPRVRELVDSHPELFDGWCQADFEELHSRVGAGGALTLEGVLRSAQRMNRHRELAEKLAVILESHQEEFTGAMLDMIYKQVTKHGEGKG